MIKLTKRESYAQVRFEMKLIVYFLVLLFAESYLYMKADLKESSSNLSMYKVEILCFSSGRYIIIVTYFLSDRLSSHLRYHRNLLRVLHKFGPLYYIFIEMN